MVGNKQSLLFSRRNQPASRDNVSFTADVAATAAQGPASFIGGPQVAYIVQVTQLFASECGLVPLVLCARRVWSSHRRRRRRRRGKQTSPAKYLCSHKFAHGRISSSPGCRRSQLDGAGQDSEFSAGFSPLCAPTQQQSLRDGRRNSADDEASTASCSLWLLSGKFIDI